MIKLGKIMTGLKVYVVDSKLYILIKKYIDENIYTKTEVDNLISDIEVEVTKEVIDNAIGASESGSATKFYNEQGNFEEIGTTEPEFSETILKGDVVWDGLFIKIETTEATNDKLIRNITFKVDTTEGERTLQPLIVYPSAKTYSGVIENCFLIRDADGWLTPDRDFDSVFLSYDIETDTNVKYDSKYTISGEGVVDNHNSLSGEETEHSRFTAALFKGVIPDFAHPIIRTDQTASANYNKISQSFQPTFCLDNDCNMIFTPYVNGAVNEDIRSNSGIIEIASHYGNDFERHDITADANTFLKNTIAVAARANDLNDNSFGTSYGFGLEFFEDLTPSFIDADYTDKTVEDYVCGFTTNEAGTILNSILHPTFVPDNEIQVGDVVWWFNNGVKEQSVVQEIVSDDTIRISPAFTPSTETTRYLMAFLRIPIAIKQHGAEGYHGTQSWACPIIAAKFKQIRLATGASWEQIRTASRETASNNGVWDMYRGFGIIVVDTAIQYITDNYQTAEILEEYAQALETDRQINPLIEYSELKNNSPVPKRHLIEELANKSDTTHNHDSTYAPISHTHVNLQTKTLYFTNKTVAVGDWSADTTYTDYGYKAVITCANVTSSMLSEVTFAPSESDFGNFASVCLSGTGTVTIYAKSIPSATITIPTIKSEVI